MIQLAKIRSHVNLVDNLSEIEQNGHATPFTDLHVSEKEATLFWKILQGGKKRGKLNSSTAIGAV